MGSTTALPPGWKQVCGKPQHGEGDHSSKCMNWICPMGQRYVTWPDVQAYFQLLYFEEDIPGVECRPENAKRKEEVEEEVTLEEAAAKEAKSAIKKEDSSKSRNKKNTVASAPVEDSDNSDTEKENSKKRGRKKAADEDYKPDLKDIKKADSKTESPAQKRTRRSISSTAAKKPEEAQFKCSQCTVALSTKEDLEIHTKNFHKAEDTTLDEKVGNAKVKEPIKSQEDKPNNVINLDNSPGSKKNLHGPGSTVTISETKPVPEVTEITSNDEPINANTRKLYTERFEVFKAFCMESTPKVDPISATGRNIDMFLQSLMKKKGVNQSVQAGYKQAILKIQNEQKLQRRKSMPATITPTPVTNTTNAPPKPAVIRTAAPQQATPQQATLRQSAPTPRQAAPVPRQAVPRQPAPAPRPPVITSRQPAPVSTRQPVPQQTRPGTPRQPVPQRAVLPQNVQRQSGPQQAVIRQAMSQQVTLRQSTPQPNSPQVVGIRAQAGGRGSPAPAQSSIYSPIPAYLAAQVSFPCRLENNSGGGESLYRAAAQHAGLGQEAFRDLRRYCHSMLLKWWQWYEPYYAFPLQVKVRVKNTAVQRNIPSAAAFKEFLKTEESLVSYNVSECETYCLANIIGVAINQLTYNLADVPGRPEQRCKWDTLEPHQGLVHQNKFCRNKEPLYVLYEDKVVFTKIVPAQK